tara:strand:+ start:26 stop:1900 length:1875 start_codon:yes stop_codon:yes gene_type:complete
MEILQLTTDKPEFSNFVNDTLVLKENSKVCLNKASFSIPTIVNRLLELPLILDPADYTNKFFTVFLNGIEHPITYQEFYDNYSLFDDFNQPPIDEFYNGAYQLWIDNVPLMLDNTGNLNSMSTFSDVLVQCCNTKFNYYTFFNEDTYENSAQNSIYSGLNFTVGAKTITQIESLRNLKKFGITAMYDPREVTNDLFPSSINWTAPQVNNFTVSGDGIVSIDGNPAMAVSPNTFDPNGGYICATPQIGDGKACMGIIFMSKGHDDPLNITGVYQPENFDVGIEFTLLASGERVLQIIDGHNHFLFSHAGAIEETDVPHYMPPNQIFTWDHNIDKFWFLVRRGRPMNGTTEFTTTIIQGPGLTPQDTNNRVIYVAKTTLNTSQIQMTTLAYSEGTGNGFDNWEYIPVTNDSKQEDKYLDDITNNLNGIQTAQTFGIQPNNDSANTDFFTNLGLIGNESETSIKSITNESNYNKTLSWAVPKNIPKDYYIGFDNIADVLKVSGGYLVYNESLKVQDIPRQIDLSLMDTTINPRAGNYISTNNLYDTSSFNKVVNYIQTDKEDLDLEETGNIDYVYEAFNLVYRKLENIQKLPITQIKAKLGFKDFRTNKEIFLKKIDGVGKFELLFD